MPYTMKNAYLCGRVFLAFFVMGNLKRFFRDWSLPIDMLFGAVAYLVWMAAEPAPSVRHTVHHIVAVLQPSMIFMMLFLTFCRVSPRELHPRPWHGWLILVQTVLYALFSAVAMSVHSVGPRIWLEGAMVCMITPTATAAAVITGKLGGHVPALVTYLIFCNLAVALWAPVWLPLVNPHEGLTFSTSFFMILGKVFPLLICPLMAAWLVRYLLPAFHRRLLRFKDLPFYLWLVSLSLAIAVTTQSIVHSHVAWTDMAGPALVSLVCCLFQFRIGRFIGSRYGERIAAGQALGQKNTVFTIWLAYTFLTPVTAIAGGFYSVWHNLINSRQLYRARKEGQSANRDSQK